MHAPAETNQARAHAARCFLRQGLPQPEEAGALAHLVPGPLGVGLARWAVWLAPYAPSLVSKVDGAPGYQQFLAVVSPLWRRPRRREELQTLLARAVAAWTAGEKEPFLRAAGELMRQPEGPVALPLLAWGARACGEQGLALRLLKLFDGARLVHPLALNLRARLAQDAGESATAREFLAASLALEPAQPAVAEQWALLAASPPAVSLSTARVHVCLYSWNKVGLLLDTLASLAASEVGRSGPNVSVTLLNNGTTSHAPAYVEAEAKRAAASGDSRIDLQVLTLPVNIGAPAARNWLLSLPESKAAEYVAFLDDDVVLPERWVSTFLDALAKDETACVVGPKGVTPGGVERIQYVHRGFAEARHGRVAFTANAPQLTDLGQYDLLRPTATAMGCCHLLHRRRLDALGIQGFDVRYTPSQVDDVAHDVAVWVRGGRVLCDGRVPVVHLQETGRQGTAGVNPMARAHALGNHFKLEHAHTDEEWAWARQNLAQAEREYLLRAREAVAEGNPAAGEVFAEVLSAAWSG